MGRPVTDLVRALVSDGTGSARATYKLIQDFRYLTDRLGLVTVPAGFVTDMASVPRLPVAWLIAGGIGDQAAVIHDYLYATQSVPKRISDLVFRDALIETGVSRWRAYLMYAAVALFGRYD